MSLQLPRVLVADLETPAREALAKALQMRGYDVQRVADVGGALARHGEQPFDAVVTELELADMSGHVLIRELMQRSPGLAVVVVAENGSIDDVIECLRRKVADYHRKPVRGDEVAASIEAALKRPAAPAPTPTPTPKATPHVLGTRSSPPAEGASPPKDRPPPAAPGPSLSELLNRRVGELAQTPTDPFASFLQDLDSGRLRLPVVDRRVSEFQRLMQRQDCGSDEVERIIGRDPALASSVLRASNTAYYSAGKKITTVRDACVRLGNRQVFAVALEVLLNNAFTTRREPFRSTLFDMWKNSAGTARIAARVARYLDKPNPEEIYIAALLHNCGEMLMVQHLAEHLPDSDDAIEGQNAALPQMAALHEKVGGIVTRAWAQPPLVEQMASRHHAASSPLEAAASRATRQLVLASWNLALDLGLTYPTQSERTDPLPLFRDLGATDAQLSELRDEAKNWGE